ncbi:MAG: hypothetical protein ACUVUU_00180 [bacterium]
MCCCHLWHFHGSPFEWRHGCSSHDEPRFGRRFFSRAEAIKDLQEYLEKLRLEIKAVEERIEDLNKGM